MATKYTKEDYENSMENFFEYEVICNNSECPSVNKIQSKIRAETIYPYIFCGGCGQQVLNIKRSDSEDWELIDDAFTFFAEIGLI